MSKYNSHLPFEDNIVDFDVPNAHNMENMFYHSKADVERVKTKNVIQFLGC